MTLEAIRRYLPAGIFTPLDIHFAALAARLDGREAAPLVLAAALVSAATRRGHICLDLSAIAGKPLSMPPGKGSAAESPILPDFSEWSACLSESPVVGKAGAFRPLIFEAGRLYLHRYWEYQEGLADALRARIADHFRLEDPERLGRLLARYFPEPPDREPDRQKIAAFAAVRGRFTVISGGPGTGKTTTVARLLAVLLEMSAPEPLRITLAAPTGKAASRLKASIRKAKQSLPTPEALRERIPEEAFTLHRLLGSIPGSPRFRHDAENPLPVDAMIVDEASMVDLALMSRLVRALPASARLILLGDRDQLASVEPGAVMGDICRAGSGSFSERFRIEYRVATGETLPAGTDESGRERPGRDAIVTLHRSYRFSPESGIHVLSRAVNAGDADGALALLKSGFSDIALKPHASARAFPGILRETVLRGYASALDADRGSELSRILSGDRILCPLREGPFGVSTVNRIAEDILKDEAGIDPEKIWYPGRPVLITRNHPEIDLFNGDTGIVRPDLEAGGDLRVFFEGADRKARKIHPVRIPEHETAYAMTVHKSQGSEFDRVILILPDRDSPVLSRELIYTAVTRARERVEIRGPETVFRAALSRRIERASGLHEALWNG